MGVVHVLKQFDYGLFKGVFIEKHILSPPINQS